MEQIGFKNFRKFENFPVMDLAPITILVGGNNAGKSTLTKALMLVFDNLREMRLDASKSGGLFAALTPKFQWSNTHAYNLHIGNYKRAHTRNAKTDSMEFEFTIGDYEFKLYINKGTDNDENSSPINKIEISCVSKQMDFCFDYTSAQMKFTIKEDVVRLHNEEEIHSLEGQVANLKAEMENLQARSNDRNYEFDLQAISERESQILQAISLSLSSIRNSMAHNVDGERLTIDEIATLQKYLADASSAYQRLLAEREGIEDRKVQTQSENLKLLARIAAVNEQFDKSKALLASIKKMGNKKKQQISTATFPLSDFSDMQGSLTVTNLIMDIVKYAQEAPKVDEKTKVTFPNIQESIQLILSYSSDIREIAEGIDRVLNDSVLEYIPAHAAAQQILFNPEERDDFMASVIDSYFERRIQRDDDEYQSIQHWLKKFGIGADFKIEPIEGFYRINVINDESPVEGIPLADMGMGSIQLVILLLRLATIINRYKGRTLKPTIIVEEPEMNLHPNVQSKLTELFYEINSKYDFQFIIETHSEYLVRKSQVLIKKIAQHNNCKSQEELEKYNLFKVYFFPENENPYPMNYRTDGKFANEFGTGFFDEANSLIFDIL